MTNKSVVIEEPKLVSDDYMNSVSDVINCVQSLMQSTSNQRAMIFLSAKFLNIFAQQKSYLDYLKDKARDAIKHKDRYGVNKIKTQIENSIDCVAFDHYWKDFAQMYDNYIKMVAQDSTNEDAIYGQYRTSEEILESARNYYITLDEQEFDAQTSALEFMINM